MRARMRGVFYGGVLLCAVTLAVVASAALTPRPVPFVGDGQVTLTRLSALQDGRPAAIVVPGLSQIEGKARLLRQWSYLATGVIRGNHAAGLPVYLVRNGDAIRGFVGLDPRNGCDLELMPNPYAYPYGASVFHDVCHGSLYGLDGSHVGGPSPFTLDELVLTVRGDIVYASRDEVIAGRFIYPR